jgi:hypothetical protein
VNELRDRNVVHRNLWRISMNIVKRKLTPAWIITALIGVLGPPPSEAITNGLPDTNNTFSNVGAVLVVTPDGQQAFQLCSGTLIAPTVFLTVAHCAQFFTQLIAPQGFSLFVSFSNLVPTADLTDVSTLVPVSRIFPNPQYVFADHHILNPLHRGDSGDIAVLILPPMGIPPAKLPTLGLLDQLAVKNGLHDATFTSVGYGIEDRFGTQLNPIPRPRPRAPSLPPCAASDQMDRFDVDLEMGKRFSGVFASLARSRGASITEFPSSAS